MQRGNRRNFEALIRDELVNRFENVISDEIHSHNQAIKSYVCDIQNIRKEFQSLREENKKLREDLNKHREEDKDVHDKLKAYLFSDIHSQREYLKENVESFQKKIKEFASSVSNTVDEETHYNACKSLELHQKQNYNLLDSKIKNLENTLTENLSESKQMNQQQEDMIKEFYDLVGKEFLDLRFDLESFKINAKGVLGELESYKRAMVIIEKKIQDIYMLLGRTPEGGKK